GYVLAYNYSSGLNDGISRLSSLSDSTGTLESYSYLGLSAVVVRSHPQPGVDLTYVKQTGESNGAAGDEYTGLDAFGRVAGAGEAARGQDDPGRPRRVGPPAQAPRRGDRRAAAARRVRRDGRRP